MTDHPRCPVARNTGAADAKHSTRARSPDRLAARARCRMLIAALELPTPPKFRSLAPSQPPYPQTRSGRKKVRRPRRTFYLQGSAPPPELGERGARWWECGVDRYGEVISLSASANIRYAREKIICHSRFSGSRSRFARSSHRAALVRHSFAFALIDSSIPFKHPQRGTPKLMYSKVHIYRAI